MWLGFKSPGRVARACLAHFVWLFRVCGFEGNRGEAAIRGPNFFNTRDLTQRQTQWTRRAGGVFGHKSLNCVSISSYFALTGKNEKNFLWSGETIGSK